MKEKQIKQICEKCARKQHKKIPAGHCASFWKDICDICNKKTDVTDIYDFGYFPEDF